MISCVILLASDGGVKRLVHVCLEVLGDQLEYKAVIKAFWHSSLPRVRLNSIEFKNLPESSWSFENDEGQESKYRNNDTSNYKGSEINCSSSSHVLSSYFGLTREAILTAETSSVIVDNVKVCIWDVKKYVPILSRNWRFLYSTTYKS